MLEKLEIIDGEETLLTLYSQGANTQTQVDNLFTDLTGWRERTVEYETVPKLFGSGSFLVKAHNPQREIRVTALLRRATNRYTMYHALYQAVEQRKALTFVLTSYDANLQQTMVGIPVGIGEVNTWGSEDITFTLTLLNLEGVFTTEVLPPQPDPDPDPDPEPEPDLDNPAYFSLELYTDSYVAVNPWSGDRAGDHYLTARDASGGRNTDESFYDFDITLAHGGGADYNLQDYYLNTFLVEYETPEGKAGVAELSIQFPFDAYEIPRGVSLIDATFTKTVGGDTYSVTKQLKVTVL